MSRPNPQLPRRSLVVAVASVVSLLGVLAISPVPATAASNPFPHDARGGFSACVPRDTVFGQLNRLDHQDGYCHDLDLHD